MIEAWKIGIRVSVLDYASIGLRAISGSLLKAEGDAAKLEKRLASIKGQFLTGGLMVGAGVAMAAAFMPAVKAAVSLEQAMNRLKAMNLGGVATGQLIQQAQNISRSVKGTSLTEAVKLAAETQSITGNVQHTQELLPMLAKIRFGLNTYGAAHGLGEGAGDAADQQFRDIVKVMELRGLMRNFNQENAQQLGDLFVKNYVASGGQVKPSDFLAMLKTGGVAGKLVDTDFMYALGHIMQESGGNRAGTAMMSLFQNLQAGRTTQQVAETLASLGLLKPNAIRYGTTGHMTKIGPDSLKKSELFQANPYEYLNEMILPALSAKGVNINDANAVINKLNQLGSARTGTSQLAQIYMDRAVIGNYITQAKNAMGVEQLNTLAGKSTQGNVADLQAKFNTLLATLGTAVLPLANKALEKLIPMVQSATDWMNRHAGATKAIVTSLLGLAGLSVVGGALNIIIASVRGLEVVSGSLVRLVGSALTRLPTILTLIGDAFLFVGRALLLNPIGLTITVIAGAAYLLYRNWSTVGPYVMKVWNIIRAVFHKDMEHILTIVTTVWNAVKPFAVLIEHAFLSAFDTVTRAINAFVSSIISIVSKLWDWLANSKIGKAVGWVANETADAGRWLGKQAGAAWTSASQWADRENAAYDNKSLSPGMQAPQYASSAGQTIQVNSNVNIDGRKVAQVVTQHQTREANRPQTGMSSFDSSMAPGPIGYTRM